MKTTQELIPSLKPVYDRYKSGDIMSSAFGSKQGITSGKFWRRPTAAEEKAKGIIRRRSNPELFFAFNKDGKRFRQYKTTFFNKNPEALTDMNNIISSNPDSWPDIITNKYGINIDEHFLENNPLQQPEVESALAAALIFTNGLENSQNQKQDGLRVSINIWVPTRLSDEMIRRKWH